VLSAPVVAIVLLSAIPHAAWNVVVRASGDRRRETALLVAGGSLIAIVLLPFLPLLPAVALPYLLVSSVLNGVYFVLISEAYAGEATAMRFALANAVVIAAYTLNDAVGVRISQAPLVYTLWMFPLPAVPTLLWLHRAVPLRWPSAYEAARGVSGAPALAPIRSCCGR
jgi:hypothetical protein